MCFLMGRAFCSIMPSMPSQPEHVTARQAALVPEILDIVSEAVDAGRPADATLAAYFRAHREFGSRDRRLFSQLVFSYFRWLGWLRGLPPPVAAAAAWRHDTGETHPVIDRLLGGAPPAWPAGDPLLLVPDWLPGALAVPAGAEPHAHAERFILAVQERPPTWLRARDGNRERVATAIGEPEGGVRGTVTGALAVRPTDLAALRKRLGPVFEVQDLASQVVGHVCDPQAGETWWDHCAGAGGKSLHLADLMPGGRIVATDVRAGALRELARRAREAGITRIETASLAPTGECDGVLVDAPCSGVGTWSRNPDMRWRTAREVVAEKAEVQVRLLNQGADAVRPGGRLVYAVCTVTRAETTDVVERFLAGRPGFVLEPGRHPLSGAAADGTFWIWPWDGPCDGMYAARFRRRA
jgi:16S rRNA (cytosine967-C5)-methyltransferase